MIELGNNAAIVNHFWIDFGCSILIGFIFSVVYVIECQPNPRFLTSFKNVSVPILFLILFSSVIVGVLWGHYDDHAGFNTIEHSGSTVILHYSYPEKEVELPVSKIADIKMKLTSKRSTDVCVVIYLVSGESFVSVEIPLREFNNIKTEIESWRKDL